MSEPDCLTLDEALGIHADEIRVYGGASGLRDLARVRSAIAMPETSFDGAYLNPSVFEMAAAHLFHLARNHPFVGGNERTALMCAPAFLGLNAGSGAARCGARRLEEIPRQEQSRRMPAKETSECSVDLAGSRTRLE